MEIDITNLHHAYLILGSKSDTDKFISSLFAKLDIKFLGNPDVFISPEGRIGIDEARIIKSRSESKAFVSKKIFIIYADQITPEAQNALLKVFEEPTQNTHFFLISKRNVFLSTLLSRLQIIDLQSKLNKSKDAEEFLASDVSKRLLFIKNKLSNEEFKISDFLEELIAVLKSKTGISKDIKNIFDISKYSNDPAANARMILEHLALTLPESLE